MKITRRHATETDYEFARRVHHLAYRDLVERQFGPWDKSEQDRLLAAEWRQSQVDVVLADGVPCGYVCVENRDDDVHVREIVIAPEFQGLGIGTAILREAIALARSRGVPVHLGTARQNRAVELYRRLGFRETGETATHILFAWTPPDDASPNAR